jgi:hypothetical protein
MRLLSVSPLLFLNIVFGCIIQLYLQMSIKIILYQPKIILDMLKQNGYIVLQGRK